MKKISFLTLFLTVAISATVVAHPEIYLDAEPHELQNTRPPKKRYRLRDKDKNYFKTDKNFIRVDIPVTDRSLRFQEAHNISSDKIEAILVWVKGKNLQTGCDVVRTIRKRIPINGIKGLDGRRMAKNKKLLVAIFNNDELSEDDIDSFKYLVKNAASYEEAVEKLNMDNQCSRGMFFEPRESGGDVIGGK